MKTRNVENKLAYVGALIVLAGVLAAADSAFAADEASARVEAVEASDAAIEAVNEAKEANRESADEAAEALRLENNFDLENQLSDISSTLVAATY